MLNPNDSRKSMWRTSVVYLAPFPPITQLVLGTRIDVCSSRELRRTHTLGVKSDIS